VQKVQKAIKVPRVAYIDKVVDVLVAYTDEIMNVPTYKPVGSEMKQKNMDDPCNFYVVVMAVLVTVTLSIELLVHTGVACTTTLRRAAVASMR